MRACLDGRAVRRGERLAAVVTMLVCVERGDGSGEKGSMTKLVPRHL